MTSTTRSLLAGELRIHGYDISRSLPAGKVVPVKFTANLTGIFEIEFENSADQVAEFTVEP